MTVSTPEKTTLTESESMASLLTVEFIGVKVIGNLPADALGPVNVVFSAGDYYTPEPPKASKADYYSDESYSIVRGFNAWSLPEICLKQAAADFYVLEYLANVAGFKPAKAVQKKRVEFLAELFSNYLNFALGGELRNSMKISSAYVHTSHINEWDKYFPSITPGHLVVQSRARAWVGWRRVYDTYGIEALEKAHEIFNRPDVWGGGFGGVAWAKITKLLIMYLKGEVTPKIFVDTTFSIQHNGGCALNKATGQHGRFHNMEVMKSVLNAHAYGYIDTLVGSCSHGILRLYQTWKEGKKNGKEAE